MDGTFFCNILRIKHPWLRIYRPVLSLSLALVPSRVQLSKCLLPAVERLMYSINYKYKPKGSLHHGMRKDNNKCSQNQRMVIQATSEELAESECSKKKTDNVSTIQIVRPSSLYPIAPR